MASHASSQETFEDAPTLSGSQTGSISVPAVGLAAVAFAAAVVVALVFFGVRRFMLAYLTAYMFVLTLSLGGLVFVMIQHQFRAGWSVNVRRVPEALAANLRWLWVGMAPIVVVLLLMPGSDGNPTLYPWAVSVDKSEGYDADLPPAPNVPADTAEGAAGMDDNQPGVVDGEVDATLKGDEKAESSDAFVEEDAAAAAGVNTAPSGGGASSAEQMQPGYGPPAEPIREHILTAESITIERAKHHLHYDYITEAKSGWLNRPFFLIRVAIYFGVWALLASFYWRNSLLQDKTGDPAITKHVQWWTPIGLIAFGLTVTFAAFDLIMSLDPHFFSTIFGVYIFSGAMIGGLATTILFYQFMRMRGLLKKDVTVEHYHDLGKLLFAFVFFWGYVAFSQFMLIWYANIPETTYWFGVRGATTVAENTYIGTWSEDPMDPAGFGWWRIVIMTLLVAHLLIPFAFLLTRKTKRNLTLLGFISGWLLVMHYVDLYWLIMPETLSGGWSLLPIVEVLCLLGFGGLFVAATVGALANVSLRPTGDPRLPESMHLHQSF